MADVKQNFRTYRSPNDERALGVIDPIENSPACSNAECHAHPAEVKTLGILDTNISLASSEQNVAESTRQVLIYTILAVLGVAILSAAFVRHMLGGPLRLSQPAPICRIRGSRVPDQNQFKRGTRGSGQFL